MVITNFKLRENSEKNTNTPEDHQGLIWKLVFFEKSIILTKYFSEGSIAMVIALSQLFVVVMPNSNFNRKVVNNDKTDQNTIVF